MSDLLNFGFNPTGTALGSEGSPSMPGEQRTGLEHPMDVNMEAFEDFVQQTQRRYGDVSDPGGTVWDPRGEGALSSKPSDYKDTDMMRPDEVAMQLNGSDDQLYGGDPVLAPYNPDNSDMGQALYNMDVGFSRQGAATLADSLATYDPKILEGIKIPMPVEPRVTNELGFAGQHGGLPEAFFDPGSGVMKQGMPEAVDRVIAQSAQFQYVDQSGIVDKYAPGTSPYDVIGEGRMAGLRMGMNASHPPGTPGAGSTPAMIRKYGGALGQSIKNSGGGGSSLSSANQNTGGGDSQSLTQTGGPAAATGGSGSGSGSIDGGGVDGGGAANSGLPSGTGGGATGSYGVNGGGERLADGYVITSAVGEEPTEKKCSKWWWLLLAVPVAGGAIYMATRKKKRGKR
jgi:hypothetical protein